ncbi:hypothetical protein ACFL3Z_00080 [Gemmatimonadota bacterium]
MIVAPLLSYFEDALSRFEEAQRRCGGGETKALCVAGHPVSVQFAGNALVDDLTKALSHLPTSGSNGSPRLRIAAWDTASSGQELPDPPWAPGGGNAESPGTLGGEGEAGVWFVEGSRIRATFDARSRLLSMLDPATGRGILWIADHERLPFYETSMPFRNIFQWWLSSRGLQLVHAAAVAWGEGGVLIAGPAGAGKSTTALCCLAAGFEFAGDDHVLVGDDPEFTVHGVWSSGKLEQDALALLPLFGPIVSNGAPREGEKGLVLLKDHFPQRLAGRFPLRAILLPQLRPDGPTRLIPASPSQVLAAWAPSSILQQKGSRRDAFLRLCRIVREIPGFILEAGPDPAQIPPLVRALLEQGPTRMNGRLP